MAEFSAAFSPAAGLRPVALDMPWTSRSEVGTQAAKLKLRPT